MNPECDPQVITEIVAGRIRQQTDEAWDHLVSCADCRYALMKLAREKWERIRAAERTSISDHQNVFSSTSDRRWNPVGLFHPDVDSTVAPPPPPPPEIAELQIVCFANGGGMGAVYLAVEKNGTQRLVAVKIPLASSEIAFRGFDTEADFQSSLQSHQSIVPVLYAGNIDVDDRPYVVMPFVRGHALTAFIKKTGDSLNKRLLLFTRFCEIVGQIHAEGRVHRDLKPSNSLARKLPNDRDAFDGRFDDNVDIKLTDFGIAVPITNGDDEPAVADSVGTWGYKAPELACHEDSSRLPTVDVYSLGAMLYEILTGTPPIVGSEMQRLVESPRQQRPTFYRAPVPSAAFSADKEAFSIRRKHALEMGKTPEKLSQALKGTLDQITCRALQRAPELRYSDANQMATELRRHLEKKWFQGVWSHRHKNCDSWIQRLPVSTGILSIACLLLINIWLTWAAIGVDRSHEVRLLKSLDLTIDPVCLAINPNSSQSMGSLADVSFKQGDLKLALALYEKALALLAEESPQISGGAYYRQQIENCRDKIVLSAK